MDIFNGVIIALLFIIGLGVGSFLNVIIVRLHQHESFAAGRSRCPHCQTQIAWFDNIPLVSFILLAGRCRSCHKPISIQYPIVELTTALLVMWCYVRFGLSWQLLATAVFIFFLEIIFVYDLQHQLIPDSVTVPGMVVALLANIFLGMPWWSLFIGAIIGGGFFAIQYFVSKGRWIGDGDIRLGVLMGAMVGWQQLLAALFLAYIAGAAVGIVLLASHRANMKQAVAFGPFLASATIVVLLYGREIISWYVNTLFF